MQISNRLEFFNTFKNDSKRLILQKNRNIVPSFRLSSLQVIGELVTSENHCVINIQSAKFISSCFDL